MNINVNTCSFCAKPAKIQFESDVYIRNHCLDNCPSGEPLEGSKVLKLYNNGIEITCNYFHHSTISNYKTEAGEQVNCENNSEDCSLYCNNCNEEITVPSYSSSGIYCSNDCLEDAY